ncbi:MAG: class I SAM-dependent methyltransferase [Pseudomonadota bacterium]
MIAQDTRFWDRIAPKYARQPIADEAAYLKKLEKTREFLRPDMQVLEFGCGTGGTAVAHAPFVRHVHAVDLSGQMLAIAEEKAKDAGVQNVSFEQVSVEEFIGWDDSYDAVLGLSLLHLLEDPDAALAKVHRILKPGGIFVSSTACLSDGLSWLKPVLGVGRWLGKVPHVTFLSQSGLECRVERAGFELLYSWRPGPKKAVFLIARKL